VNKTVEAGLERAVKGGGGGARASKVSAVVAGHEEER
jgi:hypothetical protein